MAGPYKQSEHEATNNVWGEAMLAGFTKTAKTRGCPQVLLSRGEALGHSAAPNELLINLILKDWKWGKRNFDENYVHVLWQAHKHCNHDKFSYFFFKTWHNCVSPNSNFYSPGFGDLSLGDIMERIIAWWLHKHEMCCQAAVWRLHLASEMIDAVCVCDLGNYFFFANTSDVLKLRAAAAINSLLMKTSHLFLLLPSASFDCGAARRWQRKVGMWFQFEIKSHVWITEQHSHFLILCFLLLCIQLWKVF